MGDGTNQTYAGTFTGTSGSSIIKQGTGILTVSNATSIPGTISINAGTLQLGATSFSGGTITLNANNVALYASSGTVTGAAGVAQTTISNNITLSSSVTTTGASIYTAGAARWNFTGSITGGATTGNFQTLKFDSRAGGANGGDRTSTLFSGVISNGTGGGALNLSLNITPQSSSSGTNNHPTNVSLSGINTFTGTLTAFRSNAGATSWLTIGGERWTDGSFGANTPTYGRMGSGYLAGPNNDGIFTSAINFGSTAGNIVNLDYFSSANQTWAGVIGGGANNNGALVKEGSGTLTLSNANGYNSLTTIGGGTLLLGFGDNGNGITNNILPSTTPLWMGLGTVYDPITANANMTISGGGGGGTLQLGGSAGSATQTVANLNISANTANSIVLGANRTLTITSGTVTIGSNSGLNFNTGAGGNNGATVGTSIVVFGAAPTLTNGCTVTDAGGYGLATTNGSFQVIRDTSTAALVASGGSSATNYLTTSSSGNSVTATQSVGSITTDTSAANVTLTLSGGVTLSNNVWNFGGNGTNTAQVTGGTGVNAVASNNTIVINNFNTGSVTFNTPILANGTNALIVGGTGTVALAGLNTFTGATTINSGTLQISGSGRLNGGAYAGAIAINSGSTLKYSSSQGQTLSGAISGPGGITKDTNTSDLTLSSASNIYTGTTTVSAGRIIVTAVTNLSSGGTSIVQSGTGQIYLNSAATFTNPFNISGTGYLEGSDSQNNVDGAIRMDSTSSISGTITLSGNSRIGKYSTSTSTISGQITGGFGIDFYGMNNANNAAETFVISNTANNYTGATTIYNSNYNSAVFTGVSTTLKLGASNVIPDGASAGNVVFAINGTNPGNTVILDLASFSETINGVSVGSGANARITNSVAGNSVLTIGANNTTSSFNGIITNSTGTLAITKIGNGTLTLSNTNTYTSNTTVSGGTLTFSGSGVIYNAGSNTATVSVASGAQIVASAATNNVLGFASGATWNISGTFNSSGGGAQTMPGSVILNNGTLTGVANGTFGAFLTNAAYTTTITANGASNLISSANFGMSNGSTLAINTSLLTDALSVTAPLGLSGQTGVLTKSGLGTVTLSGTNAYTGATNVNAGTLTVSSTGTINTSTAINVATGGTFRYNSSTALTVAPTLAGNGTSNRAVLGGTGTINVAVTLNNLGDVLSPGNSPGVQNYAIGQTWSSFSYDWELNDWSAAVAGTNIDQITITGTLDLSAIAANQYILNVLSLMNNNSSGLVGAGGGTTFTEGNNSWTILTATSITGFNASEWSINTTGFTDANTGTWSISQSGNNLLLSYNVVPEPSVALLGGLSLLGLALRRRRD